MSKHQELLNEMRVKLIEKEQVTFSHCVPTILHMLLLTPYGKQVDLSRWKVIIGGAGLNKGLALAAMARAGAVQHLGLGNRVSSFSEAGPRPQGPLATPRCRRCCTGAGARRPTRPAAARATTTHCKAA